MIYFAPESPRWLISKGRYDKALDSLCRLRNTRLQAMRDLYDIETRLMIEQQFSSHSQSSALGKAFKLFTVRRNRRAAMSSCFLMFMQQVSIRRADYCHFIANGPKVLRCQRHCILFF